MTVGATKFSASCKAIGQLAMAAKLTKRAGRTIHQGSVTGWATGKHVPSIDVLVAIHAEFKDIDIADWSVPVVRPRRAGGSRRKAG